MNRKTANSNSVNESLRCQHQTRNGRCRMPVAGPSATLCRDHAKFDPQHCEKADLSAALTADLTEFKSAVPINDFLSRLLLLQAQDRVSPRRASVMAYTCNLLLRTLPAIEHEADPNAGDDASPTVIWDVPGVNPLRQEEPS